MRRHWVRIWLPFSGTVFAFKVAWFWLLFGRYFSGKIADFGLKYMATFGRHFALKMADSQARATFG